MLLPLRAQYRNQIIVNGDGARAARRLGRFQSEWLAPNLFSGALDPKRLLGEVDVRPAPVFRCVVRR